MKNALTSLWNGGLTGKRPQEILTPPEILDPILDWWGGIAFDPYGSELTSIAAHTAILPDDGQQFVWPDRTFGNPPYRELRRALMGGPGKYPVAWDAKGKATEYEPLPPASYYLAHPDGRVQRWIMLGPVRSHRPWWRQAHGLPHVHTLALNSITFVGYAQPFPAPLCLMFTGADRPTIARHFGHLGDLL